MISRDIPTSPLFSLTAPLPFARYDLDGYHEDETVLLFRSAPLGALAERSDGVSRLSLTLAFTDECHGQFFSVCRNEPTNLILAHGASDYWKVRHRVDDAYAINVRIPQLVPELVLETLKKTLPWKRGSDEEGWSQTGGSDEGGSDEGESDEGDSNEARTQPDAQKETKRTPLWQMPLWQTPLTPPFFPALWPAPIDLAPPPPYTPTPNTSASTDASLAGITAVSVHSITASIAGIGAGAIGGMASRFFCVRACFWLYVDMYL